MTKVALDKDSITSATVSSLRTSAVDQVSSLLMALLILCAVAVLILLAIYMTSGVPDSPGTIALESERIGGRGDHAVGFERDLEPPGSADVEELREPTLEHSLEAITNTLSSVGASLDAVDTSAVSSSYGTGKGDSRPPGPLGEGDDIVPRYDRWELKFTARNVQTYAAQLDFFKIELAAIGGSASVDYALNVSTSPTRRSGKGDDEKRLYFMWRQSGPLLQYDRQLLAKASITTTDRYIIKLISPELETQLALLEKQYSTQKMRRDVRVKEIAKTIFESRAKERGGYEWAVIDQRYRGAVR